MADHEKESPALGRGRAQNHEGDLANTFESKTGTFGQKTPEPVKPQHQGGRWMRGQFQTQYVQGEGEESPKTSAAWHEAGHCVIGAVDGNLPTKVSIWCVQKSGQSHWIGRT